MTNYVLIMAYSSLRRKVVLLRKKVGPEHLLGKLTSPGGKIEDLETPLQAAYREFKEETGVDLQALKLELNYEGRKEGKDWTLSIYSVDSCKVLAADTFRSTCDNGEVEQIEVHHIDDLFDKFELVQDVEDFYTVRLGRLGYISESIVRENLTIRSVDICSDNLGVTLVVRCEVGRYRANSDREHLRLLDFMTKLDSDKFFTPLSKSTDSGNSLLAPGGAYLHKLSPDTATLTYIQVYK